MTFYNIIFGLLFIGAFREVIFALGRPDWGVPDWQLFSRASVLSILVFSDTIYTAVVIEDKKLTYSVYMKLLDLLSFILLSFAVVLLNPETNDMFEVNVSSTLGRAVEWTGASPEAMFWVLLGVYMFNIYYWNHLMGIDRIMAREKWVKRVQPALGLAFLLIAVLAWTSSLPWLLASGRWILLLVVALYLLRYKPYVVDVLDQCVELKPLTDADVAKIHNWPPYTGDFKALDYALRPNGWLDMFPAAGTARGANERYGAWQGDNLVAFSLLTDIKNDAAEFYVAVHPEKLKQHVGGEVTERILKRGFSRLNLTRIYLKVREAHPARGLYGRIGFKQTGAPFDEDIQGHPVRFVRMEMLAPRSRWDWRRWIYG